MARDGTVRIVEIMQEFKYLDCVVNYKDTDRVQCRNRVMNGRVARLIKAFANEKFEGVQKGYTKFF